MILIRCLVTADQRLLLDRPEFLLHFQDSLLLHLGWMRIFQLLKLLPVELEIVVLEQIDLLRVGQIDLLLLLGFWMYLQSHEFFLLMHYHRQQSHHFVPDALVFFPFNLWDLLLWRDTHYWMVKYFLELFWFRNRLDIDWLDIILILMLIRLLRRCLWRVWLGDHLVIDFPGVHFRLPVWFLFRLRARLLVCLLDH